jgi:hypothetical protein
VGTLSRVIYDPDTTPPSIPGGVSAAAQSQTTIRITWSPSTDVGGSGLAGYRVYRATTTGGVYGPIGSDLSTASLSYDDSTLTAGTQRFYRLESFDGNGNRSALSSIASATTLPAIPSTGLQWPVQSTGFVSAYPGVGGPGLDTEGGSGRHLGAASATTVFLITSPADANTGGTITGHGANVHSGTWEYFWRHSASPKFGIQACSGALSTGRTIPLQTGTPPRPGRVTYCGQFAPRPGFVIRNTNVSLNGASNVVLWHLYSDVGDTPSANLPAGARDCLSSGYNGGVVEKIAVINASLKRSTDEIGGFFWAHRDTSFVDCAFYEPLHDSPIDHPEDPPDFDHGFGPYLGGGAVAPNQSSGITFKGCLTGHVTSRGPMVSARTLTIGNCLNYNNGRPPGVGADGKSIQILADGASAANHHNFVLNGYLRGPNNRDNLVAISVTGTYPSGSSAYVFGNCQRGWTQPANQAAFFTDRPASYGVSASIHSDAYPSSWGAGLTGLLQWAANPAAPTQAEWHAYIDLFDRTVGATPLYRDDRLTLVMEQMRNAVNGVTQTNQFINNTAESGGMPSVPVVVVDPLNPGTHWHAALPTGSDRDTPLTTGTFSDGKSKIGYTPLEAWAYEQHLYVTVEQPVVSTGEYDFIDNPVGYTDHWVDPTRTSSGTGTQATPYTFNQMLQFNPAGGRHRFIVMPGQLTITGAAANSKFAFLDPLFSGTAANPVLVKAQFPATRSGVQRSQMTIIRRTSGVGSILGSQGRDYWRFDGFKLEGGHGSFGVNGGEEKAHISLWDAEGWWITRFHVDGEEADHQSVPLGSTNGGAIYMQRAHNTKIMDVILENIGDHSSSDRTWQGIEWYECTDVDISYFNIRNCYGLGVFQKGVQSGPQFQRNYIHHGIASQCYDTCYHPYYVSAGTNPANHNYWYNLVADQRGVPGSRKGIQLNAIIPHVGTHFQNFTLIGCGEALGIRDGGTIQYSEHVSFHNGVWYQNATNIQFIHGAAWGSGNDDDIVWDWNQYNGQTTTHVGGFANVTYDNWRLSPYLKDANGTNAVPSFVNFAGGDLRTNGAAVCPDHWNKFGGGTVPRGAFQPYGCRRDL